MMNIQILKSQVDNSNILCIPIIINVERETGHRAETSSMRMLPSGRSTVIRTGYLFESLLK